MEAHSSKRSILQLEKLKSYKTMEKQWKCKVVQIMRNSRTEQKKSYEKVKQFQQEGEQFWKNRYSPKSSKEKQSPSLTKLKSLTSEEFSPNYQINLVPPNEPNFITEAKFNREKKP